MFHASFNSTIVKCVLCVLSRNRSGGTRGAGERAAAIFLARDGAARAPAMAGPAPRHPANRRNSILNTFVTLFYLRFNRK